MKYLDDTIVHFITESSSTTSNGEINRVQIKGKPSISRVSSLSVPVHHQSVVTVPDVVIHAIPDSNFPKTTTTTASSTAAAQSCRSVKSSCSLLSATSSSSLPQLSLMSGWSQHHSAVNCGGGSVRLSRTRLDRDADNNLSLGALHVFGTGCGAHHHESSNLVRTRHGGTSQPCQDLSSLVVERPRFVVGSRTSMISPPLSQTQPQSQKQQHQQQQHPSSLSVVVVANGDAGAGSGPVTCRLLAPPSPSPTCSEHDCATLLLNEVVAPISRLPHASATVSATSSVSSGTSVSLHCTAAGHRPPSTSSASSSAENSPRRLSIDGQQSQQPAQLQQSQGQCSASTATTFVTVADGAVGCRAGRLTVVGRSAAASVMPATSSWLKYLHVGVIMCAVGYVMKFIINCSHTTFRCRHRYFIMVVEERRNDVTGFKVAEYIVIGGGDCRSVDDGDTDGEQ